MESNWEKACVCRACGAVFPPSLRARKLFCSARCRIAWHSTHRIAVADGHDGSMTTPMPRVLSVSQLLRQIHDLEAALTQQRAVADAERRRADLERGRSEVVWRILTRGRRPSC